MKAIEKAAKVGCYDCGLPYGRAGWVEAVVPDKVWKLISPTKNEGGILCISCIAARIDALGYDRKVPLWLLGTEPFQVRSADPCDSEEDLTILRNWEFGHDTTHGKEKAMNKAEIEALKVKLESEIGYLSDGVYSPLMHTTSAVNTPLISFFESIRTALDLIPGREDVSRCR